MRNVPWFRLCLVPVSGVMWDFRFGFSVCRLIAETRVTLPWESREVVRCNLIEELLRRWLPYLGWALGLWYPERLSDFEDFTFIGKEGFGRELSRTATIVI